MDIITRVVRAGVYFITLLWLNLYICRDFFTTPVSSMASMQGYWVALAERAQGSWLHPSWWPYWNAGMPFEFAYAPLVPGLTAAIAAMRGIPHAFAFHWVAGIVYIAVPLTLFLAAWGITGSRGYSFAAALIYSLSSTTQLFAPDGPWSVLSLWQPWRLTNLAYWDETPHLTALVFLPPTIFLLWRLVHGSVRLYLPLTAVVIAAATYASVFAPASILLASVAIVACVDPEGRGRAALRILGAGVLGYALAIAYLPPSLLVSIVRSSNNPNEDVTPGPGSLTALALVILGWTLLSPKLRSVKPEWLRFFLLFLYMTAAVALIGYWLHRGFLPQPRRYRLEMEMALALAIAFGIRPLLDRIPAPVRRAVLFLAISLAAEQVVGYRRYAKLIFQPHDVTQTVEYRAAMWANENLPGTRVMFPGSMAQWATTFAPVQQLGGGSWSLASNPVQQQALRAIFNEGARSTLAWLEAFGVGAIAISGSDSAEFWKPYSQPAKFEGVLPVLWRESGVTIYRVPYNSFAHVVPKQVVVQHPDLDSLERFDHALDVPAQFQWTGRNRAVIESKSAAGQAVSIQVSYHPGWRASVEGRKIPIHSDGLGLMWLECPGDCHIALDYSGGAELNICRWITYLTALGMILPAAYLMKNRFLPTSASTATSKNPIIIS